MRSSHHKEQSWHVLCYFSSCMISAFDTKRKINTKPLRNVQL